MKARFLALAMGIMAMLPASVCAQTAATTPPPARTPVVVELYTSQGCSDCPRANRLLGQFAREHDLIPLTFPVGYWDYLGWADTFAQPDFEDRQRLYTRALHARAPYTPQLVIDGMRQVSASDWDNARATLDVVQATPAAPGAPSIWIRKLDDGQVHVNIGAGDAHGVVADVWMLAIEPGPLTVLIRRGENRDSLVSHYNLVQHMIRVGGWTGTTEWFERRCVPECAVLVQAPSGGRILAAVMTQHEPRH
jgi:hypothetical protein